MGQGGGSGFPVGPEHAVQQVADGATRRADVNVDELSEGWTVPMPAQQPSVDFVVALRQQAYLMVPLTRLGSFSGVFSLMRVEQRPFTDRDVALVETFADQALIAIENSRLFTELEESNPRGERLPGAANRRCIGAADN